MVKIGEIVRDIQFRVFDDCSILGLDPNLNAPTITSDLEFDFAPNVESCFDIFTEELDTQEIIITSPNSLNGIFNPPLPIQGLDPITNFCWTPLDTGTFFMIVKVEDTGCPPLSNTYTYRLNVSEDAVEGCTDNTACNYNASATSDDGSCQFNDCLGVCGGNATVGASCDDSNSNTNNDVYKQDCSCSGTVSSPENIPTLSQWGVIILLLLFITTSGVFIIRQQHQLATVGLGSSPVKLPLVNWALFNKMMLKALPIIFIAIALITVLEDALYIRNIIGTFISSLIIVYLLHFVIMSDKLENDGQG